MLLEWFSSGFLSISEWFLAFNMGSIWLVDVSRVRSQKV